MFRSSKYSSCVFPLFISRKPILGVKLKSQGRIWLHGSSVRHVNSKTCQLTRISHNNETKQPLTGPIHHLLLLYISPVRWMLITSYMENVLHISYLSFAFSVATNDWATLGLGSIQFRAFLLACSRLRDSGESVNWEKEREKKRRGWGETRRHRLHFSRSCASYFRFPFLIFVPSQLSESLEQATFLRNSHPRRPRGG